MENQNGRQYDRLNLDALKRVMADLGPARKFDMVIIGHPSPRIDAALELMAKRVAETTIASGITIAQLTEHIANVQRVPFALTIPKYQQIRFSPSRKRRTRKKWRNNPKNWGWVETEHAIAIDREHVNPFTYGISWDV